MDRIASRYPGIKPFEKRESVLFFGRNKEVREIVELLDLEQVVVIYGKAGLGKSSLLNAGLLPLLEDRPHTTLLSIRMYSTLESPVELVRNALDRIPVDQQEDELEILGSGEHRLWHDFKKVQLALPEEQKFILIIDQAEELFDQPIDRLNDFQSQISELLRGKLPKDISRQFRDDAMQNRQRYEREVREDLYRPVDIRLLLAIRADRLSLLHALSGRIPNIFQNLFEIKPLSREAAKAALEAPASLAHPEFDYPSFRYQPEVLESILDFLSDHEGGINTFQLQLIGQYVERIVIGRAHDLPASDDSILIDKSFFANSGEKLEDALPNLLSNYYENQIRALPPEEQTLARRFIEEGLIVDGRRVSITEGVEANVYRINEELLQKLLDSRLIRSEYTHLGRTYEISHDSLLAPILRSYEKRKMEEEQHRIRVERESSRRELMRARKRNIIVTSLAIILFIMMAIAASFYSRSRKLNEALTLQLEKTDDQKEKIDSINQALIEAQETRDSLNFLRYYEQGKQYSESGEFKLAIESFKFAKEIAPAERWADSADILSRRSQLLNQDNLTARSNYYRAKEAMNQEKFIKAIQLFQSALNQFPAVLKDDEERTQEKLDEATIKLNELFIDKVNQAASIYDSENENSGEEAERINNLLIEAESMAPYLDKSKISAELKTMKGIRTALSEN